MARIFSILLLFTMLFTIPASAHEQSLAATKISFENKRLIFDLMIDQKSILEINGYDITKETTINEEQLTSAIKDKSFEYITNGLKIKNNGALMTPELEAVSVPDFSNVNMKLVFSSDQLIDKIDIDYNLWFENSNGKHKNLATIEQGENTSEFLFASGSKQLSMEAGIELPFSTAMKQFFILGAEHIWFGPDHLLFLIALILLGGRFIDILKIVTSFTIAHSVTLILASLEIVSLPGAFVEAVIALSILYMAVENLFVKTATYRWALTFAFGLIHGFGFAGSLAEIQIPHNHFVSSLLVFNLGVEVAQLVVVALLLPVIIYLKRFDWNIWFVRATTSTIAAFGLNWFVHRTIGIELLPFLSI